MFQDHRVRRGLNEWRRVPEGYVELPPGAIIQAGDVQQLHAEWFAEYPAKAFLVGRSGCGRWFRKAETAQAEPATPIQPVFDDATIERAARAMAVLSGWLQWDTATTTQHTPNGCEPDEERAYWRDMARAAFSEAPQAT